MQGGIRLATYELTKRNLNSRYDSPLLCNAISAICGDLASSLVKVPREVITQNLQTNTYKSTWEAVSHITRTEGIQGLFRGGVSTSCRDVRIHAHSNMNQFRHCVFMGVLDSGPIYGDLIHML